MKASFAKYLGACAVFSFAYASADTMYWVDVKSFNSTFDQNSARSPLSVDKSSEEGNDNYNWAVGISVDENGKPTYSYADPVTVPTSATDVIFDYSKNSGTYSMAGSIKISAGDELSVKSMTFSGCSNNWIMFNLDYSAKISIAEDLVYNDNQWLRFTTGDIDIGGNVYNNNTQEGYNNLIFGSSGNALTSFSAKNVYLTNNNSVVTFSVGRGAVAYEDAKGVVSGIIDFGGTSAKVQFAKGGNFEQFLKVGGVSGTSSSAQITTESTDGLNYTMAFTNSAKQTFMGKVVDNSASGAKLNIIMDGASTQVLSGENAFTGYVKVESGTLYLKTADGAQHGKLTLNGGTFGAVSNASFASAEWNGGKIGIFNTDASVAESTPETITVEGEFVKISEGAIAVDFNNVDVEGLLDTGMWYELITAGEFVGFSEDANDDFIAENLGANADFRWNEDFTALEMTITSVPEPALISAIFGFFAAAAVCARIRRSK